MAEKLCGGAGFWFDIEGQNDLNNVRFWVRLSPWASKEAAHPLVLISSATGKLDAARAEAALLALCQDDLVPLAILAEAANGQLKRNITT